MDLTQEYIKVLQASAERDAEIGAVLSGLRDDTAKLIAGQDDIARAMEIANTLEKERREAGSKWGDLARESISQMFKSTAGGLALLVLVLVGAKSCGVDVSTLLQAMQPATPAVQLSPGVPDE